MTNNEKEEELLIMEKNQEHEDDSNETPPRDIVAFNESRSCSEIFRMYKDEQLDIQPDFQRNMVWTDAVQTKFIDSLIKQLPIPSMCFNLDYKTEKRLIVDGMQRVKTIIRFLDNSKDWKLSKLKDIDDKISGKKISEIRKENPTFYGRVQNLSIPVTVIRSDLSRREHSEYLFTIFHRLNTGGIKLSSQEIRNAIYSGSLNDLLKKIVDGKKSPRLEKEEFLLRLIAFNDRLSEYNGNLSEFLNRYMSDNRNPADEFLENKKIILEDTLSLLEKNIMKLDALITKNGKTRAEAIVYGIITNLDSLRSTSKEEINALYDKLMVNNLFSVENLKEGLSQKAKVKKRLSKASQIFASSQS